MARPVVNYAGMKIGKLTVIGIAEAQKGKNVKWLCRCECGANPIVSSGTFSRPYTISCGCWKRVARVSHGATRTALGGARTREHIAWANMLSRCRNPKTKSFAYYGGRGITVCNRWAESFEHFLADVGPRPVGHSLDRINNDGNYEPGNVRWANVTRQMRNRSDNRTLTMNGVTLCISEWAERVKLPAHAIVKRLNRGWSEEAALSRPLKH